MQATDEMQLSDEVAAADVIEATDAVEIIDAATRGYEAAWGSELISERSFLGSAADSYLVSRHRFFYAWIDPS